MRNPPVSDVGPGSAVSLPAFAPLGPLPTLCPVELQAVPAGPGLSARREVGFTATAEMITYRPDDSVARLVTDVQQVVEVKNEFWRPWTTKNRQLGVDYTQKFNKWLGEAIFDNLTILDNDF